MTNAPERDGPARHAAVQGYRSIAELIEPHWSEGDIQANGIRQHYYRTGGGKPALVLLHGFMESGLCWMRAAKALEPAYDVVMLDARGHGRSDGIASGYSPELLADDAAGAIRALGLERPSLLGHSMGGTTAALVAAGAAGLVRSILLEDPLWEAAPTAAPPTSSEGYMAWFNSWLAWLEQLKTQTHDQQLLSALARLPPGSPLPPEDEYVPWVDACARLDLDLVRLSLSFWSQTPTPVSALVAQISCPVLVMRGSTMFPVYAAPQQARQEESAWPNVTIMRFENTGHLIHREQFDLFISLVETFLAAES